MRREELEDDLGCLSRPTLAAQSCLAAKAFTSTETEALLSQLRRPSPVALSHRLSADWKLSTAEIHHSAGIY